MKIIIIGGARRLISKGNGGEVCKSIGGGNSFNLRAFDLRFVRFWSVSEDSSVVSI
ncbi:MAG: hypothetical protein ACXADY_19245 [Candidatus Hodarchaeales archaeon]|jgi:hypothetical protein